MKLTTKLLFAGLMVFACPGLHAQILKPIHWSYGAKKISATEAVVFLKATIDAGWHLYSQHVQEGGPVKTTFTFPASKDYTLSGATQEPAPIVRMESAFNMKVGFFEKTVIFQQKIKLNKQPVTVKGTVEFMTCNDEKCLPPDTQSFSISIK
jgi:DsbC/DsbD-like thiol-disulfide interchange protein